MSLESIRASGSADASTGAAAGSASFPSTAISRRLTSTLFLGQCLASMAFIAGITVYPLISVSLSGQRILAGLPVTLVIAGAATAAYPIGWLTERAGRRRGLSLGLLIGAVGALIAAIAVVFGNFIAFVAGLALIGTARAAADQMRYAAAEVNLPERRGRALSLVVFGGTFGAIAGPALVRPTSNIALGLGISELAGPIFLATLLLGSAGLLLFTMLRPDPREIGRQIAVVGSADEPAGQPAAARPVGAILRTPTAQLAIGAMVCGQAAMVAIMSMTSLHMADYNHSLGSIAAVISAHTVGMFGFSIITGWLVDRLGSYLMISAGALILIIGALIAPLSPAFWPIAMGLFLVGLGWNFCYVAGSALLSSLLRSNERGRTQGVSELAVGLSAGSASLLSGVALAAFGFLGLCLIGTLIAAAPFGLLLRDRLHTAAPSSV